MPEPEELTLEEILALLESGDITYEQAVAELAASEGVPEAEARRMLSVGGYEAPLTPPQYPAAPPTPPTPPLPPAPPYFERYPPRILSAEDIKAAVNAGTMTRSDAAYAYVAAYQGGQMSETALKAALVDLNKFTEKAVTITLTPGDTGYIDVDLVMASIPKAPTPTVAIQTQNVLAELDAGTIGPAEAEKRLRAIYEAEGYTGAALGKQVSADLEKAAAQQVEAALPGKISEVLEFYEQNQASPYAYRQAMNDLQRILEEAGPDSAKLKEWATQIAGGDTKYASQLLRSPDELIRALLPTPKPELGVGLQPGQPPPPFVTGYQPPVPTGPPSVPPPTPFVGLSPEQQTQMMSAWLQPPPELPEGYAWMPTSDDYARIFTSAGKGPVSIRDIPELAGYPEVWKLTPDQPPQATSPSLMPGLDFVPPPPLSPEQLEDKGRLWEMSGQTIPFEDWMKQPFNLPETDIYGTPNPYIFNQEPFSAPPAPPPTTALTTTGGTSLEDYGLTPSALSQSAFLSAIPQGMPKAKTDVYRGMYSQALDDMLETLGRQIRSGAEPSLTAPDFFANYPFEEKYQQLTPREKGFNLGQFAPFVNWRI